MTETAFSINDLLRRKLQTSLTIISLTICVASTLFLLLFSGQIGIGIAATSQRTLTGGISNVFSQILTFVGALIFAVGAVIVSFIVFLMMSQRTKDFGLMKATGCPNGLVFGYFFTELLGVTFIGVLLGVALGFGTDYVVINMPMFQVYNASPNLWFIPLVFAVYFAFALIFGAKPIFDAARMSPIKAISQVQYFGLSKGTKLKPLSKNALTIRIASRSLFRRKSATVRIVIFLSTVFLLLTVSIAGGIIAGDTSSSWLQKATGKNIILIADSNMANQYTQLLLKFSGEGKDNPNFNYTNPQLFIPNSIIQDLSQTPGVANVDTRLVWRGNIQEVAGYTFEPSTLATLTLGDNRQSDSLIVGVDPKKVASEPYTRGQFLNSTSNTKAVVGDSIALSMYSPIVQQQPFGRVITNADPLQEGVKIGNTTFKIIGISLDPLNNGNVTYVPLEQLKGIIGASGPNIALVSIDPSVSYSAIVAQIKIKLQSVNANLTVTEMNQTLEKNANFLGSLWAVIMLLPAFALASAAFCLISYLLISIDEQHHEFAILRATGAKPRGIVAILAVQSLIVLFSSFAVGASLGTIICIIILTAKPVISGFTVLAISGWLLAALAGMFLLSLYPATRFAKKPLPAIMS